MGSRPFRFRQTPLMLGALILVTFIGLRFRVGSDWPTYLRFFDYMSAVDLFKAMRMTDPLYGAINWTVAQAGGQIWIVNLICATIFAYGLVSFSRWQPNPPLAMLVSIPYLVIVVAMGYTRQSAALGLVLVALTSVHRGSIVGAITALFIAASFHKSAIILVPLFGLTASRGRFTNILMFGLLGIILYFMFASSALDRLMQNYVEEQRSSSGAMIRVVMNLIPSLMFLSFRNRFALHEKEVMLWTIFSVSSVAALIAVIYSPSSTVVDRLSLYLIPIQVLVLSRLPLIFGRNGRQSMLMATLVISYSLAVQLVWLLYAGHAEDWIPYRSYLWLEYGTVRVNGE